MTDHERGCQGREYTCTCGYDAERDALVKTLTAALKPFAALATEFLDDGDMANKADDRTVWGFNDHDVSYGDFRRAHAALSAAKEQSA